MLSRSRQILAACLLPLPAACGGGERPAVAAPLGWRAIATDDDRRRMRDWRAAWMAALAAARNAGHGADLAAGGALFLPDAALAGPAPPPGRYLCRTTKLGARATGLPDYVAYPPFACVVAREGDVLSLAKTAGSQRPTGLLLPGDSRRMIFLGTMMLSDERTAQQYGRDPERDMVGAFERIGPARWRLALPYPRWESVLDVLELVPA